MNIDEILLRLEAKYPTIRTALNYSNAHELLFATILSAQCTDKRVNVVTEELFAKYKTIEDYAEADIEELKKIIHSTGFYNNKAKNIIGAAKKLRDEFDSEVPDSIEGLITLPGVARKTANVVLSVWFRKNEGIAVDTHVGRISSRLGITDERVPEKIEKDLMKKIPNVKLGELSLRFVQFGRDVCQARKPKCSECPLNDICPSAFKLEK
ncbi:endonuclease III [Candidatus Dojkabacteria bacterium]|nr:endonuclease III [Candidatus Dojkabacteria bacterium]